ncbi:hypothetical protein M752DRAFT_283417 [Aspergillus phoenicis ATCC 13157]|uniref:Mitochondrial division protein 1 n=1 Tax=Aspergillus phoenicis ATCC 13157 TaxID=1353007 RepID=A0A370PKS6_ASPPH|nr:hypothetical protein M752DRAFT_283417 [Aspergillus phoenicis ATCC 13157]
MQAKSLTGILIATKIEKFCAAEGDYDAYKADLALSPYSVRQYMLLKNTIRCLSSLEDPAKSWALEMVHKHFVLCLVYWTKHAPIAKPGLGFDDQYKLLDSSKSREDTFLNALLYSLEGSGTAPARADHAKDYSYQNIYELASYGTQRQDINPEVVDQHLLADLQYACQYRAHHLQQSQGCTLEFEILAFLKQHFLHWLEILALMGRIFEAVEMNNTLQFRTWNFYIAGSAPLQLYYAGLAFAPEKTSANPTSHSDWVWSVAFSQDGHILASGSYDRTIKLWDTATGTELQTLTGLFDSVSSDGLALIQSITYGVFIQDLSETVRL